MKFNRCKFIGHRVDGRCNNYSCCICDAGIYDKEFEDSWFYPTVWILDYVTGVKYTIIDIYKSIRYKIDEEWEIPF